MRLSPRFRFALYGVLSALFVTGAAWLVTDSLKNTPEGETWQAVSANLLMVHGGAAMVTLMFLGGLAPLHVQRAWRGGKNLVTGTIMVALTAVLVVTAFWLYYSGSDTLRYWMSNTHILVGILFPAMIVTHIFIGRRRIHDARS